MSGPFSSDPAPRPRLGAGKALACLLIGDDGIHGRRGGCFISGMSRFLFR